MSPLDHIAMHRLWMFASDLYELELPDRQHVLDCAECFEGLKVCLKAETFGQALKVLGRDDDGYRVHPRGLAS